MRQEPWCPSTHQSRITGGSGKAFRNMWQWWPKDEEFSRQGVTCLKCSQDPGRVIRQVISKIIYSGGPRGNWETSPAPFQWHDLSLQVPALGPGCSLLMANCLPLQGFWAVDQLLPQLTYPWSYREVANPIFPNCFPSPGNKQSEPQQATYPRKAARPWATL